MNVSDACVYRKILFDFSKNRPDKKAIVHNAQSISYSELWNITISLTNELKRLGVKKNDFIAIYMPNSIEMVISIFAILNCHAIVMPINIDLPPEQISRILIESNPKIMLYHEKAQPEFSCDSFAAYCVDYTKLNKKNDMPESDLLKYERNDLAYCIFTSGSSGVSKGVLLTYEGIFNHVDAKISSLKLTCESRLCLSFNIGFVASIWQILAPALLGAQLFIYDSTLMKNPYQFLERLEKDEINVVSMIPHLLYSYCQYIGGKHPKLLLPKMKHILLTGEKVDKVVVERFYKDYDHISLINAYGQSECSDDTFQYEIPKNVIFDEVPIGKPLQNVSYHILDDNLEEAANEEKGELYIGGACLSKRYLNDEQLTKEKFVTISNSIFFRTGDIVKLNKEQDVIYIGRADNQIKIRGYRIEPEEIEAQINQVEGIRQSVVTILKTNEIDKILGAFYTSKYNISPQEIVVFLSSKLPPYMLPSAFIRVEGFILNSNGKIDRNRVHECLEIKPDDNVQKKNIPNEWNDIQKRAFEVIAANLNNKVLENLSFDTNFPGNGLDSMTFIKIVFALECEFDFKFDDDMFLPATFPTAKSIIEYVESKIQ